MQSIPLDAMMADIKATFPKFFTRPLAEFGAQWAHVGGIWTGGDQVFMPDDLPIFSTLHYGEPEYDGPTHTGFAAWLEARGWSWDQYDGATFFLVPLTYFDEPGGQR